MKKEDTMKKVVKFVCSIAAGAAAGFGAYCLYKNVMAKKNEEDFDDFDDCFDEDDAEDIDENREYVSINITEDAPASEETEEAEEVEETTEEISAEEEVKETK